MLTTRASHHALLRACGFLPEHPLQLHGQLAQPVREQALIDFKAGATHVLLTTDVASRGLHLRALRHVVNLDMCALPPPPPPSRTQLSTRMRTRAAMTITQSPVLLNR